MHTKITKTLIVLLVAVGSFAVPLSAQDERTKAPEATNTESNPERDELIKKFKKSGTLTVQEWYKVVRFKNHAQVIELLGKPNEADPNGAWMEYQGKLFNTYTERNEMLQLQFSRIHNVVFTINEGRFGKD